MTPFGCLRSHRERLPRPAVVAPRRGAARRNLANPASIRALSRGWLEQGRRVNASAAAFALPAEEFGLFADGTRVAVRSCRKTRFETLPPLGGRTARNEAGLADTAPWHRRYPGRTGRARTTPHYGEVGPLARDLWFPL